MNPSHFIDVGGAVLAAEFSAGTHLQGRPPLVMLHAGVADSRMWQAPSQTLGAAHPLLRYDRRGFGQSHLIAPTPHSQLGDLWAVMDAAGLQQALLIGCSQGGRIALDAALAKPARVLALVLVAPAVSGAPQAELAGPARALDDAIEATSDAGDLDTVNELEAHLWLDGPGSERGRVSGAARALFLSMNGIALRAADPGPCLEPPSAWERLQQVHAPTTVIWGELDLPHVQARCEHLVQRIPQARPVRMAGVAHLPPLEAPDRFNAELQAVLDGLL
jgi:pimeloyl-ACP methyl ester carboxylesterase